MIDLWFGDSYVLGAELAEHYGCYDLNLSNHRYVRPKRDRPDLAFPHIVSTYLGHEYLNLGHGGSSIEFQMYLLTLFCKTEIQKDKEYTAFFCLPFSTRRFFKNNEGKWIWIQQRNWWNNNSDLDHINYTTTMSLNHLYLLSKKNNITPYFLSLYQPIEIYDEIDIIPENLWLIDKKSNLVTESWGIKDPPNTWRKLKFQFSPDYHRYIKPCGNHPNIFGHKEIAACIISKLNEKRNFI